MGCGSSTGRRGNTVVLQTRQPHPNHHMSMNMNTKTNTKAKSATPIQITGESLQQYLELEYSIHEYEKKHVLENYQIKTEQLEQLEQAISQLLKDKQTFEIETSELQKVMGIADLRSVKEFILQKSLQDHQLTRDEEKFLDSLNKQEIVDKELESITQQRDNLKVEVEQLVIEGEKLQNLYQKRDELLDAVFEGQYGSDIENQLERELDWLLEQKHHVDQAHFRWKQAHMMIKQAGNQLGLAIQKWKDFQNISTSEMEKRYYCVAEARNNLVAASQNIQGAQRYLPNINLPYCAPDEVETLDKAITYIFTDMQTIERHGHALTCYETTYKRTGALRQWLEQVLNSTIAKDLQELTEECKARAAELRGERIRLIRKRIKEITGKDIDLENGTPVDLRASLMQNVSLDSGVDSELDDSAAADEQIAQLFESNRKGANSLTPDPTRMPLIMPTPLPTDDLAPLPSNEEIFGKIEKLRNRHKEEIQEFQKAQRMSQARMTAGLKEKLHQRRSRRSRMEMHRRELEALSESPTA